MSEFYYTKSYDYYFNSLWINYIIRQSSCNQNYGLLMLINNKIHFNIKHDILPKSKIIIFNVLFAKQHNIQLNPSYRSSTFANCFLNHWYVMLTESPKKNIDISLGDFNIDIPDDSLFRKNYVSMLLSFGFNPVWIRLLSLL